MIKPVKNFCSGFGENQNRRLQHDRAISLHSLLKLQKEQAPTGHFLIVETGKNKINIANHRCVPVNHGVAKKLFFGGLYPVENGKIKVETRKGILGKKIGFIR